MRTCFAEWCLLLLSFLSTAYARPQYIAPLEGVQTGPYHTYNCNSHIYQLSTVLNALLSTLQQVLADVSQSRASDAYTTFFGDIAFAPIVRDILSNITAGTPIPPGPHAIRNAPPDSFGPPVTPQFVCITDYNQMTWSIGREDEGGPQYDAYAGCLRSFQHIYSVFGAKFLNNTIVLCPLFFTYPVIPLPSTSTCLPVDTRQNRFGDSGEDMLDFQLWKVLIELAHGYIYARAGHLVHIEDVNDCTSLITRNAVNSATNYAFYAANIRLKCKDFPRITSHSRSTTITSPGSVELLEIDANTTLSGGSRQSVGNNSTGASFEAPNAVTLTPLPS